MKDLRHILLIINPVAGTGISDLEIGVILRTLTSEGARVTVRFTEGPGDAKRWVREAGADCDLVAFTGGDGTLQEVAEGHILGGHPTPIAFLPAGSTCDMAATLEISRDLLHATEKIMRSEPVWLDVGRAGSKYFTYVCSFGAFTESSWQTPREAKQTWGHLAYVVDGAKRLGSMRSYPCRIEADGEIFDDHWYFGGLMNTRSIGGIVRLPDEDVRLDDGSMELLLVREPTERRSLALILSDILNQSYYHPDIVYRHVKHVSFSFREDVAFTVDGEYGGHHRELTLEVLPRMLPLVY